MNNASWLQYLVSWIASIYLHVGGKTSFTEYFNDPSYEEFRRKNIPIVYVFWHNVQVPLAYDHRNEKAGVIVSQSKDGEYIAQVMCRMGLKPVRGSTTRGGIKALKEALVQLEEGYQIGITPDGPKGPPQTIHDGAVGLAKLSGLHVVPIGVSCRRKKVFNSWDKFVLPLPFGVIRICHGKPFKIPPDMENEQAKSLIRDRLIQLTELAHETIKQSPSWPSLFVAKIISFLYNVLPILLFPLWVPILLIKFGMSRSFSQILDRLRIKEIQPSQKKRIWIHTASVGEWRAIKPLVSKLKSDPGIELIFTSSTPEARNLILKEEPNNFSSLLPLDVPILINKFCQKVNPDVVYIVETEIWPNMIRSLRRRHVPVFILNGRLSARSLFMWRWVKPFIRRTLNSLSGVFARTDMDADRFIKLGLEPKRIKVLGNIKFDSLPTNGVINLKSIRQSLFGFEGDFIVVAGSIRPGEEMIILDAINKNPDKKIRWIIAPRHMERVKNIEALLQEEGLTWNRWSQVKTEQRWLSKILLIDTLGDLNKIYETADVAFLGGSIVPKGGQNPLEPASFAKPILFGPHMENFIFESTELKKDQAAIEVKDASELAEGIDSLFQDEQKRLEMGRRAAQMIKRNQGVTNRLLNELV